MNISLCKVYRGILGKLEHHIRFQKNELIETQGKEIILKDSDTLYDLAGLTRANDECLHQAES